MDPNKDLENLAELVPINQKHTPLVICHFRNQIRNDTRKEAELRVKQIKE